jgi:hypothetical protein
MKGNSDIDEGKCTWISTTLDSCVVDIGGLVVRFSSPHFFLVQFSLGDTNCIANCEYAMSTFIVAGFIKWCKMQKIGEREREREKVLVCFFVNIEGMNFP